jgi:hypothetical protein
MNLVRFSVVAALALLSAVGAAADNLLVNSDFNEPGDTTGWVLLSGEQYEIGDLDADGCRGSFSVAGQSPLSGTNLLNVTQFVPLAGGTPVVAQVKYQVHDNGLEPPDAVILQLTFVDGSGAPIDFELVEGPASPPGVWQSLVLKATAPAPTNQVWFSLAGTSSSSDTFSIAFDRAYLGSSPRIFADDLEGGEFCRWTSIGP